MPKLPNIVPITDLRQDATTIVKRVTTSREPVVITQRGRAAAVMVSMETYEHSQHELELLRVLARGEKEIESGKAYELEEVLSEADFLLKEKKR
jgi:prevent-host-death family protein